MNAKMCLVENAENIVKACEIILIKTKKQSFDFQSLRKNKYRFTVTYNTGHGILKCHNVTFRKKNWRYTFVLPGTKPFVKALIQEAEDVKESYKRVLDKYEKEKRCHVLLRRANSGL
ncbi:unnamed protein product, partial [marine sediment metagenome]